MKTIKEWLKLYLAQLERQQASYYTVKNYGTDLGQFLDYCAKQGVTELPGLSRELVRNYMAQLAAEKYVKASIARRVFEMRAFGDYLIRVQAWEQNLFRRIYAPRFPQRLPRYLSHEQVQRLLSAPDPSSSKGLRDRAILETLYASGVRVSELGGLNMTDLNLESGEMSVIGKGDKERMVLLGRPALIALRAYLRKRTNCTEQEFHHARAISQPFWRPFVRALHQHRSASSGYRSRDQRKSHPTFAPPHLRHTPTGRGS